MDNFLKCAKLSISLFKEGVVLPFLCKEKPMQSENLEVFGVTNFLPPPFVKTLFGFGTKVPNGIFVLSHVIKMCTT